MNALCRRVMFSGSVLRLFGGIRKLQPGVSETDHEQLGCSDVIVITRRHDGGIVRARKDQVKMRKSEHSYANFRHIC